MQVLSTQTYPKKSWIDQKKLLFSENKRKNEEEWGRKYTEEEDKYWNDILEARLVSHANYLKEAVLTKVWDWSQHELCSLKWQKMDDLKPHGKNIRCDWQDKDLENEYRLIDLENTLSIYGVYEKQVQAKMWHRCYILKLKVHCNSLVFSLQH
jgi:hypothetical protein